MCTIVLFQLWPREGAFTQMSVTNCRPKVFSTAEPSEGSPRAFTQHKKESSTLTQETTKVHLDNLSTTAQDSRTILKLKMSQSVGGGGSSSLQLLSGCR